MPILTKKLQKMEKGFTQLAPFLLKACTTGFISRCLACVRAKAAISSTACDGPAHVHASFSGLVRHVLKHGPKSLTVKLFFFGVLNLQAP